MRRMRGYKFNHASDHADHATDEDDTLPPGLDNPGNLCWLNAIMQALTHCDLLVEAIDTSMHCLNCTVGPKCVLCSVEAHIKGVSSAQGTSVIAPNGIISTLPVISQTLFEGQQEDAHEFLRNLVSGMQMSLMLAQDRLNVAKSPSNQQSSAVGAVLSRISSTFGLSSGRKPNGTGNWGNSTTSTTLTAATASGKLPPPQSTSNNTSNNITTSSSGSIRPMEQEYPFSLFRGSVHSQVCCTRCGNVSVKADPIEDLELEVSCASTLETALGDFCRVEVLNGANAYSCDVCRTKTTARRCMQMHTVPAVLSIQLKRFVFNGKSSKITHYVQYPELLDLQPYLTDEAAEAAAQRERDAAAGGSTTHSQSQYQSQHQFQYQSLPNAHNPYTCMELFAIVVHLGKTMQSGHYVAYVRTELGWHRMDDSRVRRCSTREAMEQSAYILFYQQAERAPKANANANANANVNANATSASASASSPLPSSGPTRHPTTLSRGSGSGSEGAILGNHSRALPPPAPLSQSQEHYGKKQLPPSAAAGLGRKTKRHDKDFVQWGTNGGTGPSKRQRREIAAMVTGAAIPEPGHGSGSGSLLGRVSRFLASIAQTLGYSTDLLN